MSRKIPLTQGLSAIVDDEDYEILSKYKWCANGNTRMYAKRHKMFPDGRRMVSMHREILGLDSVRSYPIVDHINHNSLDNRRSNLRIVNKSQNNLNRERRTGSVWRHKQTKKWCVRITIFNKKYNLGCFDTEKEAEAARKSVSILAYRLSKEDLRLP